MNSRYFIAGALSVTLLVGFVKLIISIISAFIDFSFYLGITYLVALIGTSALVGYVFKKIDEM